MATLNEDLERIAATLRKTTGQEVEIVDKSVYVNFGHHLEAIVVDPVFDQFGKHWHAEVLRWDQSGGVESEMYLGSVREAYLPGLLNTFLEEQKRQDDELEKMLEQRPEE